MSGITGPVIGMRVGLRAEEIIFALAHECSREDVFDFIVTLERACQDEELLHKLAEHFTKEIKECS